MSKWFKLLFSRANESKFSKRFVKTYSYVIAIPLVLFLLFLNIYVDIQYTESLKSKTQNFVKDNGSKIRDTLNDVNLVEKMINANGEMLLFLLTQDEVDEEEKIDAIISHSVTLERIHSVQQNISAIKIFCVNEKIPERFPTIMHANRGDFENRKYWTFNDEDEYVDDAIRKKENLVTTIRKIYYSKNLVGYLQVSIPSRNFFSFLYDSISKYDTDYIFEIDEENKTLIPVLNDAIAESNFNSAEKMASALQKVYFNGKKVTAGRNASCKNIGGHIVAWNTVPELNIVVCHKSDIRLILDNCLTLTIFSILGLIIILIFLIMFVRYTTDNLLSGVYTLMEGMNEVRRGNLNVKIPVPVSNADEITESQETFNLMTVKIRNQIEQIKTEQQLISDTEMKAMLNQINAHFLYNVLETIRMQALLNDDEDTAENILLLGKMMRYCLRWRENTVSIEKEIEYITSYIQILNVRNDYKIDLKLEIPQALYIVEIPKMIIQPFIENAFFYAIEPLAHDSVIRLYTEEDIEHGRLWINVEDYGPGMEESKINEIYEYLKDETPEKSNTGSIGLKNIQQRLTALYGSEYRLVIDSVIGRGTVIKVPVPFGGIYDDNSGR